MPTCPTTLDRDLVREAVEAASDLFAALDRVEADGWDCPTGQVLLAYARREIVRPAVRAARLRGSAAESAAAAGWSAAWEALCHPSIRVTRCPWGFVTAAVRRAVLSDRMADRYRTGCQTAWRIERFRKARASGRELPPGEWHDVADPEALVRPWSLTALIEDGWEEPPVMDEIPALAESRLDDLVAVLTRGGWSPATARDAVLHIAEHAPQNRPDRSDAPGWRILATDLGIPPWQTRRLTVLLLGAPGWPGLVERLATGGPAALRGPMIEIAVRATRDRSLHTPPRAAAAVQPPAPRRSTRLVSAAVGGSRQS